MSDQVKSVGHVAFYTYADGEAVEFYRIGSGDFFRAPVVNPIGTGGHRSGRFECTEAAWPLLVRILGLV